MKQSTVVKVDHYILQFSLKGYFMSINVHRYPNLDGWRGISILLVLATHTMPIGPEDWEMNNMTGVVGMAIFFTLSGFLITSFLLHSTSVTKFIIRRFARIVPLAWLYLVISLWFVDASWDAYPPHFFFYANWSPMPLTKTTEHLWSLCMEMQFYVGVAIIFAFFKQRGLLILPLLALMITGLRAMNHIYDDIHTYYRMDEILAGCILALIYHARLGDVGKQMSEMLGRVNQPLLIILVFLSSHPLGGFIDYFRPYLVAILVGSTLYQHQSSLNYYLNLKALVYIASISYALYVIHLLLLHTWLGEGTSLVKYSKRPLLYLTLFILAHLSTFYYEKYFISASKKLIK